MLDWINPVSNFFMIVFTTGTAVATLAWWLSVQFSTQRELFFGKIQEIQTVILAKLDYHEQHDDRRFSEVRGDVLDIRLRNAAIDGPSLSQRGHLRRLAELQEATKKDT